MTIFKKRAFWLAALLTFICSVLGSFLAKLPYLSLIGALVLSLLLGIAFQSFPQTINKASSGIGFISNRFLRLGIILLGFKLNLITLANAGIKTIILSIIVVSGMITLTYYLCKKFGAESELAILTACGCGICGAAAVMGTVFTLIEIFLKPFIGLDASQFGIMAGGSLHEIAHAVATGGAGGAISLQNAIIMKLSRVLLLAPVALLVGLWYRKKMAANTLNTKTTNSKLPIPWFLGGFILTSIIGTFVPFIAPYLDSLVQIAYLFLGMAMAALGMSVNFKVIFKRGKSVFSAAAISSTVLLIFMIIAAKALF